MEEYVGCYGMMEIDDEEVDEEYLERLNHPMFVKGENDGE